MQGPKLATQPACPVCLIGLNTVRTKGIKPPWNLWTANPVVEVQKMIQEGNGRSPKYFKFIVILGVVMNLGAAIPGIIVPGAVLSFLGLGPEITEFWVRLACWLLILLSFTYVPTAIDPYRSPAYSWLTVGARWGGVFFVSATTLILGLNPRFLIFALGDLIFAIPELIFLALAFRVRMPRIAILSITAAISIALLAGLGAYTAWYGLFRVVPGAYDQPDVPIAEYFKYGSIGTEPAAGIPYWIWLVVRNL